MKKIIAIGVLAIGCSNLPAAAPAATNSSTKAQTNAASASPAAAADKVIAKGKGIEIKESQLDAAMVTIKSSMRGQTIPPDQLQAIKPQMLERIIAMRLLAAKATEEDKSKAKENAQRRIAELKKSAGGEDKLLAQLQTHGIAIEEFTAKLTEETVAEAVLERELKVQVSDADAKKYYEDNPASFEQPEKVRAAHILLMTQGEDGKPLADEKKKEKLKQIEDLLKKARAGEDFAKLAKENSEDPGSKDRGGEYEFPRGQMVPEFEKAAFELKKDEVSDVVTTQYGYHIIKLYEKIPAKKVPYEEVADRLKDALKAQGLQKQMPEYVSKLKQEADIQILDESLKARPMGGGFGGASPAQPAPPESDIKKPEQKTK